MKILVVYYSMYGHVHRMAEAVAEGARSVSGAEVNICRVPETLPEEVLKKMGALEAQKALARFRSAKWTIWHRQTRSSSVRPRVSATCAARCASFSMPPAGSGRRGPGGKSGKRFYQQHTQHGGQESTILSFHITLLHHGMILVGLPYTFKGQMRMDEITGGSPYGASTIAGVERRTHAQ